ncbi:MAG: hypothetical protein R3B84_06070 [Zavarzinella sp.]
MYVPKPRIPELRPVVQPVPVKTITKPVYETGRTGIQTVHLPTPDELGIPSANQVAPKTNIFVEPNVPYQIEQLGDRYLCLGRIQGKTITGIGITKAAAFSDFLKNIPTE